jgi:putative hemolysin
MITIVLSIISLVLLLIFSAFFSGVETSITAINKLKIRSLCEKKNKKAQTISKLLEKPGKVITTILIGNNLVNIAATSIATTFALTHFQKYFTSVAIITTIVTVFMTILILIIGEIIPKNYAMVKSERVALGSSGILKAFTAIMSPLTAVLSIMTRYIIKMMTGTVPSKGAIITEEEIRYMLKISEEEGILEEDEQEMIQGIFELGDSVVREIMTPRTDVACVELSASVNDVIKVISISGHSRIPVYEESIDNVKGVIFAKDLLNVKDKSTSLKKYINEAYYVPETKVLDELLSEMRKDKNHIAIVVDEYGGTSGVVAIEDILEEIVGEIQDEYDEEELPHIIELGAGLYEFSAKTSIDEVNDLLKITIPNEEDYDTLGGFMFSIFGRIPNTNDEIKWNEILFKITEVQDQRIIKIQVEINDIIDVNNEEVKK